MRESMILNLLRNRDKNSNIYSGSRHIELSKKVEIVLCFVYNDRDVRIGKRRNLYKTGKVW